VSRNVDRWVPRGHNLKRLTIFTSKPRPKSGLDCRTCPIYARQRRVYHTVDYAPCIKSQLASRHLTLGPCVVKIWSRTPQNLGKSAGLGGVSSNVNRAPPATRLRLSARGHTQNRFIFQNRFCTLNPHRSCSCYRGTSLI
jgi:hypothetical protein